MFPRRVPNRRPQRPDNHSAGYNAAAGEPTGRNLAPFADLQRSLSAGFRFLVGGLAELCYPPTCVLCHGPLPSGDYGPLPFGNCGPLPSGSDRPRPSGKIAEFRPRFAFRPCSTERTVSKEKAGGAVPASAPRSLCSGCRATLQATTVEWACDRCSRPQPPVSVSPASRFSAAEFAGSLSSAMAEDTRDISKGDLEQRRLCPSCCKRSGEVQRSVALGMYRDVMREAVVAAKRLSFQPLALALGEMLGHRVRQAWGPVPIGAVTFIPSHWTRRCGRGGCPAQLLAQQVGRAIGAPVLPILRSCRRTEKQGTLGDVDRRTNVCGAFRAKKGYALLAPRVLVVDDVWTTGATLEEAARVIRQGYDAEVFAAVIARAVGTHDG